MNAHCFTYFKQNILQLALPEKFTYPFCYKTHPLALAASKQLQAQLAKIHPVNSNGQGRMYGVLVVRNESNELGYLSALSGNTNQTLSKEEHNVAFVPAIHQSTEKTEFELTTETKINALNSDIAALEANPKLTQLSYELTQAQTDYNEQLAHQQHLMRENKKSRKAKRAWLEAAELTADEYKTISIDLSRASVTDKKALLAFKESSVSNIDKLQAQLTALTEEISQLKKARKKLSAKLQKHYFKQYQMLNIHGKTKDLTELFADTIQQKPPAGAGDCAAPKLLQYAFAHKLTPICMAEFWWGAQPKSEIRKHGHFYPSCQGKCQPILSHMLSGMAVDDNPLLENPAKDKDLEIVYQDEHLVVVNKPADFLSVPGKTIQDSVYSRIKALFPQATGSLIIHRLDMATSGLLMLALTERAHKHLQQQFINKEVSKRYVAIIEGELNKAQGEIRLPLRCDFNDRPRQMVCFEHGKYAETKWQVIEKIAGKTKVLLYPITGRTHQLRMHCAHPDGLNMPIVGDDLYGQSANRLHLHAQYLSFTHPISKKKLTFELDAEF